MAAQSFLARTDAPGVIWINGGVATVFTVAQALAHRALLTRLANASERDAQDDAARGDDLSARFNQGMADGFRVWTTEISAALAAPRLDARKAA